jgi:hypothetical protein
METGITDVIGRPHDFLPPRSDEFQKLCDSLIRGGTTVLRHLIFQLQTRQHVNT